MDLGGLARTLGAPALHEHIAHQRKPGGGKAERC
jgi:hypothetical protein